ncbi:YkgJ family cysteine cluster protein [Undibacterium sp. Di26W]|uniref:YkgJ family cysteine cluster protein n=1 Tax=Undibacterium sp. Di26W TaxID=3413035 RepID=UPI003BF01EAB
MPTRPDSNTNDPCLTCGACCASFRVSFYWAEADSLHIPIALTEAVNPVYSCMAGTNQARPRCQALSGDIGKSVACTIYAQRPSPCHEVQAGDEKCQKARARHGLPPLPPLPTLSSRPTDTVPDSIPT